MNIIDLMCALPPELVSANAFDMIGLKGVVFLDSAATSTQLRAWLSACLSHFECEYNQYDKGESNNSWYAQLGLNNCGGLFWLLSKGVRLKSLHFYWQYANHYPLLESNFHLVASLTLSSAVGMGQMYALCLRPTFSMKIHHLIISHNVGPITYWYTPNLLTNLRSITICYAGGMHDWFVFLVRSNPSLESFTCYSPFMLSTFFAVVDALTHCPRLTSLVFTSPAPARVLLTLAQGCKHLRRLSVSVMCGTENQVLQADLSELNNLALLALRELHITSQPNLTAVLVVRLTHLVSLRSKYMDNTVLAALGVTKPPLQVLYTHWEVTDSGLVERAQDVFANLQVVKLTYIRHCAEEYTTALAAAIPYMGQLRQLSLQCEYGNSGPFLPDYVLQAVAVTCTQLRSLAIRLHHGATELWALALRNPYVESVNLSTCVSIPDIRMANIVRCWPRLRELRYHCRNLTVCKNTLVALGQHCLHLRELELDRIIVPVKDKHIAVLVQGCTKLRSVALCGRTAQVTAGAIALLQERVQTVRVIDSVIERGACCTAF